MEMKNIESDIVTLLYDYYDMPQDMIIESETDLRTMGMDSINYIRLIVKIEEHYGIEFEDSILDYGTLNSVKRLAEYVMANKYVEDVI
ncbi:MAG: acyl carrier protein [Pseudobutyrivibrio sp.]|nr:acyl carrier protein [Clostridia bacterium]MCF0132097.1 acyl carrier protein [Pseudobutyrivibrio sp.]